MIAEMEIAGDHRSANGAKLCRVWSSFPPTGSQVRPQPAQMARHLADKDCGIADLCKPRFRRSFGGADASARSRGLDPCCCSAARKAEPVYFANYGIAGDATEATSDLTGAQALAPKLFEGFDALIGPRHACGSLQIEQLVASRPVVKCSRQGARKCATNRIPKHSTGLTLY